jgi:Flp pilus assembly protein TadD
MLLLYVIAAILGPMLAFFLVVFLSTLFHELGHAIPALIFTKSPVIVFVGMAGEGPGQIKLNIGRLHLRLNYKIHRHKGGLCKVNTVELDTQIKEIVFLSGGVLAQFLIALVLALHMRYLQSLRVESKFIGAEFFIFVYLCTIILYNLIPFSKPLKLTNGKIIYRDGYQLYKLISRSKIQKLSAQALAFANKGYFQMAAKTYIELAKQYKTGRDLYRCQISAHALMGEYDQALAQYALMEEQYSPLQYQEHIHRGNIFAYAGRLEEALLSFQKANDENPKDPTALSNIGFYQIQTKNYSQAITTFNEVLSNNAADSYSYANRGLAKIKSGHETEGLEEIQKAISLNNEEAYSYRSMGIYYLDKKNHAEALINFNKSKALNIWSYKIDELIAQASVPEFP